MTKTIKLPCYGITITLTDPNGDYRYKGGTITYDEQKEVCPHCNKDDCCFECFGSLADFSPEEQVKGDRHEDNPVYRLQYNGAIDGITSLILAHACAGINVESPAYLEGIETAIQAAASNL